MTELWTWLALAGLGAAHGLSPASGWLFAAASGVASGEPAQAWRALLPLALGHVASIMVVAYAVTLGMAMEGRLLHDTAGVLLIGMAAYRWLAGRGRPAGRAGFGTRIGIALWSFLMATAHGAGLMLVPALVPLCASAGPAREITGSGSLMLALAAVGVHMAAALATTGVIAAGVCRGLARQPRLLLCAVLPHAWTAALATTGGLLLVLR